MNRILFTKELSSAHLMLLENLNVKVENIPFIKTVAEQDYKTKLDKLFQGEFTSLIITSPYAASLFAGYAEENNFRIDTIYTVGEKTAMHIRMYCQKCVVSTKGNAEDLANMIVDEHTVHDKICFVSGEMRRNVLPIALRNAQIDFSEISVYRTLLSPPEKLPFFNIIVFFSPSAVRSFYLKYKLSNEAVYTIGPTTQKELLKYNAHLKVNVAEYPSFESLVQMLATALINN